MKTLLDKLNIYDNDCTHLKRFQNDKAEYTNVPYGRWKKSKKPLEGASLKE